MSAPRLQAAALPLPAWERASREALRELQLRRGRELAAQARAERRLALLGFIARGALLGLAALLAGGALSFLLAAALAGGAP